MAWIESRIGVEAFLREVRDALKARSFQPGRGAAGDDSQGERETAQPGHPDRR